MQCWDCALLGLYILWCQIACITWWLMNDSRVSWVWILWMSPVSSCHVGSLSIDWRLAHNIHIWCCKIINIRLLLLWKLWSWSCISSITKISSKRRMIWNLNIAKFSLSVILIMILFYIHILFLNSRIHICSSIILVCFVVMMIYLIILIFVFWDSSFGVRTIVHCQ